MGELYTMLGLADPREFGNLPEDIQLFWEAWLEERIERTQDRQNEMVAGF